MTIFSIYRVRKKTCLYYSEYLFVCFFLDELLAMGFVEQLVGLIVSKEFSSKTEYQLLALDSLIYDHNAATIECGRVEFGLQSYLENVVDKHKDEDAFLVSIIIKPVGTNYHWLI